MCRAAVRVGTGISRRASLRTVTAVIGTLAAGGARAETVAILQGLDKTTARISTIEAPLDRSVRFGALVVTARACLKRPPEEPPETAAFLEIDESHLAGIGSAAEHALAEESAAELHAVETADEDVAGPALDGMRRAALEKRGVERDDFVIDPGLPPVGGRLGAAAHHCLELAVAADGEAAAAHGAAQPARDVEAVERQDAAAHRIDPEELPIFGRLGHREDAGGIGLQQEIGCQRHHRSKPGGVSPAVPVRRNARASGYRRGR